MQKELEIMDEIMSAVTQTDAWQEVLQKDELVKKAWAELNPLMEQARNYLPKDLWVRLEDAACAISSAHGDAGILFGIHVADAIRAVTTCPGALSHHIVARLEQQEAG